MPGLGHTYIDGGGYVCIFIGRDHPLAYSSGYAREHRLRMALSLDRPLLAEEIVHHKNGVKTDNSLDNLEIISRAEHTKHHRPRLGTQKRYCKNGHLKSPKSATNSRLVCRFCERANERKRYLKQKETGILKKSTYKPTGTKPGARNRIKTHCPHGHPYSENNTIVRNGRRSCRRCKNEQSKRPLL